MSIQAAADAADFLTRRPHIPEHVVHREFAEETVVLNLETGRYHGVNVVGGRMLDALAVSATVGDAARLLADEFEQPLPVIEADLGVFCVALAERSLLELRPA